MADSMNMPKRFKFSIDGKIQIIRTGQPANCPTMPTSGLISNPLANPAVGRAGIGAPQAWGSRKKRSPVLLNRSRAAENHQQNINVVHMEAVRARGAENRDPAPCFSCLLKLEKTNQQFVANKKKSIKLRLRRKKRQVDVDSDVNASTLNSCVCTEQEQFLAALGLIFNTSHSKC